MAWHAGKGVWQADEKYTNAMNQYAIGIEMVAIGSEEDMSIYLTEDEYNSLDESLIGYTETQYTALQGLVETFSLRDLCLKITAECLNTCLIKKK